MIPFFRQDGQDLRAAFRGDEKECARFGKLRWKSLKGKDPFLGCRIGNDCGKAFAHTRFVAGDCQDMLSAHPKFATI